MTKHLREKQGGSVYTYLTMKCEFVCPPDMQQLDPLSRRRAKFHISFTVNKYDVRQNINVNCRQPCTYSR